MKRELIDFDALFTQYMQEWYEENKDKMTPDEMEEKMSDLYFDWVNMKNEEIGGLSPKQYFDSITDVNVLIEMLVDATDNGSPSMLLLDKIAESDCVQELKNLISKDEYSAQIKMQALNLLVEKSEKPPIEDCVKILADKNTDEGLRELIVEIFAQIPNDVKNYMLAMISYADTTLKGCIAEILVNADKDEKTYELLIELFKTANNRSLYAGYLGKYGDVRALSVLYKALDDCNYVEFMEVRNSIEELGGTVDDEYRDFSDDPYYKALKNLK